MTAAGLEVILEEPEEEYVTSSEEEEEQQESPQSRSLHSLEGSEGIGSAEGDSGSNASVESSSGVHSSGESRHDPEGESPHGLGITTRPRTVQRYGLVGGSDLIQS